MNVVQVGGTQYLVMKVPTTLIKYDIFIHVYLIRLKYILLLLIIHDLRIELI